MVSVDLSVYEHISGTTHESFTKFSVHASWSRYAPAVGYSVCSAIDKGGHQNLRSQLCKGCRSRVCSSPLLHLYACTTCTRSNKFSSCCYLLQFEVSSSFGTFLSSWRFVLSWTTTKTGTLSASCIAIIDHLACVCTFPVTKLVSISHIDVRLSVVSSMAMKWQISTIHLEWQKFTTTLWHGWIYSDLAECADTHSYVQFAKLCSGKACYSNILLCIVNTELSEHWLNGHIRSSSETKAFCNTPQRILK